MEIVATVVVVGVKLPRRPRVERGRRRWGGVIRRRILIHGRMFLPGVLFGLGIFPSTPTTQTTPAAAIKNVSAHVLVNQARTKMKVDKPPARHAPLENLNHPQEKIIVKQTVDFQTPSQTVWVVMLVRVLS